MSNKLLNKKINKYLNKQINLRQKDKITLKDGFNLMRMKIHELRQYFGLDSLRGIKIYLLDSENIGRTKSRVWSAERVIQAYNDFEKDNFFIDGNSPVRIPIIFLYKENRVDEFLNVWNPERSKKKNKKIKRFIIPLDGSFASHLESSIRHFSPDDMQIIHYAKLLKIYQNHFPIGRDCKNCIKGVRIVSKDKFRDHNVDSSIRLAPQTIRKKRGVIIPRTVSPKHKKIGRRPVDVMKMQSLESPSDSVEKLTVFEEWHLKKTGKLPDPNHWVTRLSPAKKTRKRGIVRSPSGLTPGKKRGTRRGGKSTKRTRKKRKLRRKHRRTKGRRRR
mgnify:CR=1 FL=1|tara:strand:- start:5364 stop:6356 length:993 start_codon:yes stop_codon:yes gene_type:complete